MLSSLPYNITLTCSGLILSIGVARSKPNFLPTSRSIADRNVAKCPDHGLIAPSSMLFDLSGIINSGSNSILMPRPLHSLHAPNGELNENVRGSKSPSEIPQRGQELRCEYIVSLLSTETTTTPLPTLSADCIESKSLLFSSADGLSLSTITSMVCFFCLSSRGYCGSCCFSLSSSSFCSYSSSSLITSPSSL